MAAALCISFSAAGQVKLQQASTNPLSQNPGGEFSVFSSITKYLTLRSFFEANTPRSFQVTHKASEANKKYLIGLLNAGGEIFQVTIYATASAGDTYKIQQLNISRQTAAY